MNKARDLYEKRELPVLLALLVISIIPPFVVRQALALRHIYTIIMYATLAGSPNVINGYSDQICPGQAGFFTIGAYTCAPLSKNLGIDFWIVLPIAEILTALVGLIVSLPTPKLSGIYLSIVTLGASGIIKIIAWTWTPVTGGALRIKQIPYPNFFGLEMSKPKYYYFIFLIIEAVFLFVTGRALRPRVGCVWMAIHEDQVAARSLGVEVSAYEYMNFMYGAFWAGITGMAYAPSVSYIKSLQFATDTGSNVLVMVVIGGQGTLLGSILGLATITILTKALRFLENWRYVTCAFIIILIIWIRPQGLMGASDPILAGGEIQKKDSDKKDKKTPEVKEA